MTSLTAAKETPAVTTPPPTAPVVETEVGTVAVEVDNLDNLDNEDLPPSHVTCKL